MIEIPVHDETGRQVGQLAVDEQSLGGEVRYALLKQAYVRQHANRRLGAAANRSRSQVAFSTRKLYRQKGTGNARRGPAGTNLMRGGGRAHAKRPKSWRQRMPDKMRRLANRNALLAKAVDGQIRVLDKIDFDKPSTKRFAGILGALKIDRSCLVALPSTAGDAARSAANVSDVSVTHIDRLNAYDLLNHRYVLADKASLSAWIDRAAARTGGGGGGE